ncbi:lipase domain-containing protein [Phthorimaea operculella]|nr:lipase domain-containing protein [Phthorimaea operculella]
MMRLLVASFAIVALCYGTPISVIPGDNSHYVEGVSRYIWMPDGDGVPHLVDLYERPSADEMLRASRDRGANNQYWLYSRQRRHSYQLLVHNDTNSVQNSNYQPDRPTVVIVHGWNNNGNSELNPNLRDAFLQVLDCNVIVVDWSDLASSLYFTSANGVPSVGQYLGDFLVWLLDTAGGNWDQVHLVGHSLGAHVVGNAGRRTGNRVRRITGLDPAGPTFGNNDDALQATDAVYVECIHTDGGVLGIFDPICQVNFYPNGGRNAQPGCWISTCSHSRSHHLMESSVYNDHFVARQCNNLQAANDGNCNGATMNMGNAVLDKNGSGFYGLTTGDSWPF